MKMIFLLFVAMASSAPALSKVDEEKRLFLKIQQLDHIIFEESFNQCKTSVLEPIIPDDFEFYHDVAGLQYRQAFLSAVKKNICSDENKKPIRKLVEDTMEVYPLKDNGKLYGAIQNGTHEFYIKRPGEKPQKTGIAKFTHLWVLEKDQWILKRVLSFDHKPAFED